MSNTQAPEDLCVFLIRQRVASSQHVANCMREWQDTRSHEGKCVPMHDLLVERGAISTRYLCQLLDERALHLTACPACGQTRVAPGQDAETCARCQRQFEPVTLAAPEDPDLPQIKRYQLERLLGTGSMGSVHLALDPQLNRAVAIKTLSFDPDESPDYWERFQREGRLAASIRHPSVVRILALETMARPPYLVMEYVEGQNMEEYLNEPFELNRALEIVMQAAQGVAALHAAEIIHRDLKPANILLDIQLTPKVTDFGFARLIDQSTQLTHKGQRVGTPHYMAPEQFDGFLDILPAADVYSLGIILYRALTAGSFPFQATTMSELFVAMTAEPEAPSPRDRDGTVPEALAQICSRATRRDPAQRYPHAAAFAEDLAAALARPDLQPTDLPSSITFTAMLPSSQRSKGIGGPVAALLAILTLVAAILLFLTNPIS